MRFSELRARALAERLDLDVAAIGICHACLSFVSCAIGSGDAREIRRWTREVTPWLWDEGLALPLQVALERARQAGVVDADEALADVCRNGSASAVVGAVVQRLAADLLERADARMGSEERVPSRVIPFPRDAS